MTTTSAEARTFKRSTFLKGTGALVVAIGLPRLLNPDAAFAAVQDFPIGPAAIDPGLIDSWIAIDGEGIVTMKTGKVELGTGTVTSTMQLVADELDVPMSSIRFVQSDTWVTPDQGATAGSQSTPTENGPAGVRQAAAEARLALLNMASAKLNVPVSNLTVSNGLVSNSANSSQAVSYADLIGGQLFNLRQTGKAVPKPYTAYKVVGTSVPRLDVPEKVFASFTYTGDVRVPGMVYARLVRPPTLGSTLVKIDGFAGGKQPPGLIRVVQKNNFVAVVAEREEQAIAAARELKVTWNVTDLPNWETYLDDLVTQGPSQDAVIQDSSFGGGPNVDNVLAAAKTKVAATYYYPIQIHGGMGASASTAWVQGQTATVWSATQNIYALRSMLATALNLPAQNIHCIFTEGTGCYGQNKADDVSLDAAVISQIVGRPVKVQYTRADEMLWENFGQAYTINLQGAVDTSGAKPKVTAWLRDAWTSTRGGRPGPPASMASGILMGFPEPPLTASATLTPSQALNSVDGSNSAPSYKIAAARLTSHTVRREFLSGPLRSPSRIQNTFANESFMDELAYAANTDPVNFRLDHLADPRLIAVIQGAADLAKWEYGPRASNVGTGRYLSGNGIAGMLYEGNNGYAAAVVNVTVDTKTGKVRVNHIWECQDCGPAINPDGMKNQAQGGAMQGISRSLIEELKWGPTGISSKDWVTYPVIRFNSMPAKIDISIISRPDQAAQGAGEVMITTLPAAIGNAIFDATGKRLRRLPFTPERVRAALTT